MFLSIALLIGPCVRVCALLTRYLSKYIAVFHRTYINDALRHRDEHLNTLGSDVNGQGHTRFIST